MVANRRPSFRRRRRAKMVMRAETLLLTWILYGIFRGRQSLQQQLQQRQHRSFGMKEKQQSKFAYVFMAFGCEVDNDQNTAASRNQTHKPGYRPYIANMLVATKLLRRYGSRADVIAMFKFHDEHQRLAEADEAMLQSLGIQIRYIPWNAEWHVQESKHFLVGALNKVHVWNLTDYQRVLFVDGDVMPLQNVDYLMELSFQGVFQQTVVLATARVPMIAGLFVVTPNTRLFEQVYAMVHDKIIHNQVPKKYFDTTRGWGHAYDKVADGPLLWQSNRDNGTLWDYHGANSDQGIFYYVAKYMERSLTQILASSIVHFGVHPTNASQTSVIRTDLLGTTTNDGIYPQNPILAYQQQYPDRFFLRHSNYSWDVPNCQRWMNSPGKCVPPYSDHAHFTHPVAKPWQHTVAPPKHDGPATSALDLWWQTLYQLQDEHDHIRLDYLLPSD